jgi:hypothetical protein
MKIISSIIALAGVIVPVIAGGICKIVSLSGGGSHGAFEAGVLANLIQRPDWKPWDVHLGVSAGSLGITGLLKDDYQENMEIVKTIWSGIKTSDVIEPLKSSNSLSGNDKVTKLITETHDSLLGNPTPGRFFVGVTDLVSGEFIPLELQSPSPNLQYVLASTAIPVIFPPVAIKLDNGVDIVAVDGGVQKNEFYLSGLQYCPTQTSKYVMDLIFANTMADASSITDWNLWNIAMRSVNIITNEFDDMYLKDVISCSQGGTLGLELRVHFPPQAININALDFNHGEELWDLGYYNVTTQVYYC